MKKRYLRNQYSLFLSSFKKIDIKIFFVIFFDLLFYFSIFFLFIGADHIIQTNTQDYDIEQFSNLLSYDDEERKEMVSGLFNFVMEIILIIIGFILLSILSWSVFKGIVWGKAIGIKLSKKLFLRFFFINLSWFIIFFLVALLFGVIIITEDLTYYVLTLFIIFVYFTNLFNIYFLKKQKIKSVLTAVKTGFTKFHHLIIPYLILITVFAITLLLVQLIIMLLPEAYGIGTSLSAIIFLTYAAWARYYLVIVVENL